MKENKTKYSESLKDPRWQKKRLEIMQRDDFTCQICGHQDKPLHVHHIVYHKGKMPWEYDDKHLITLCEDCHCEEHKSALDILGSINRLRELGVMMIEIESLLEWAYLSLDAFKRPDTFVDMLGGKIDMDNEDAPDYWGFECPPVLCERLANWRRKLLK